jgi:hypothetical protein
MEFLRYFRVHWDRSSAVLAGVAGAVLLLIGYSGVSETEYIAEQIPYVISDGFGALMLFSVAAVLWISADLRDEWRELAQQGADALAAEEKRVADLNGLVAAEVARQLASSSGTAR